MGKKISIHKEINQGKIVMRKENTLQVFYGLLEKYNKQEEYKDLKITKSELWKLAGFRGKYNSSKLWELVKDLTKSEVFNITHNRIVSGSIFVVEMLNDGTVKIEVPRTYQKYLFYKKDIEHITEKKEVNKRFIKEVEYNNSELKEKHSNLVLIKKAQLLGITGKYNKRLYALLSQFEKTGFYVVKWQDFRGILEIPISYKTCDIDKVVLKKAKQELEKVGLVIKNIKKIKKGRSIDRLEIRFYFKNIKEYRKEILEKLKELKTKSEIIRIRAILNSIDNIDDLLAYAKEIYM